MAVPVARADSRDDLGRTRSWGWGGFWGWDPVENAGALPWFTSTAFLHSVMVQERRSMLRVWNMTLVILTFFLTIFGTFMTRSGIVQSVHGVRRRCPADGAVQHLHGGAPDVQLRMADLSSPAAACTKRARVMGLARGRLPAQQLDPGCSRRSSSCLRRCSRRSARPSPDSGSRSDPRSSTRGWCPIGLVLLVLTGVGPLLAWRKSSPLNLLYQFVWPVAFAVVTAVGLYAIGFTVWVSGLCFALCAFVIGTIGQEFVRGAQVRRGATGTDVVTALVGLVMRSRQRYGGYIVHVGIVLMFLGLAGAGYKLEQQVIMNPGRRGRDRPLHRTSQPPE